MRTPSFVADSFFLNITAYCHQKDNWTSFNIRSPQSLSLTKAFGIALSINTHSQWLSSIHSLHLNEKTFKDFTQSCYDFLVIRREWKKEGKGDQEQKAEATIHIIWLILSLMASNCLLSHLTAVHTQTLHHVSATELSTKLVTYLPRCSHVPQALLTAHLTKWHTYLSQG